MMKCQKVIESRRAADQGPRKKSKASRNVTAWGRSLDRADVLRHPGTDGLFAGLSLRQPGNLSQQKRDCHTRSNRWRPMALRRRLSTVLPFRGWKALRSRQDNRTCPKAATITGGLVC